MGSGCFRLTACDGPFDVGDNGKAEDEEEVGGAPGGTCGSGSGACKQLYDDDDDDDDADGDNNTGEGGRSIAPSKRTFVAQSRQYQSSSGTTVNRGVAQCK